MRNAKNHERQQLSAQNRERNYYFAFQNVLVQQFITRLDWKAFRLLAFMLCKVRLEDSQIREYSFSVREYCDVCGIYCDSGRNYECVKEAFEDVKAACAYGIERHAGEVIKWLEKGDFDAENHVFCYQFSAEIAPYIFNLQKKYTQIKLDEIMRLRSVFSQRLYVLMRSYKYHEGGKTYYFTANNARARMGCSYKRFADFKRVLEKACEEIFATTGMRLEVRTDKTKQRRHVDSVNFCLLNKVEPPTDQSVIQRAAHERQQKEIMRQARQAMKEQQPVQIGSSAATGASVSGGGRQAEGMTVQQSSAVQIGSSAATGASKIRRVRTRYRHGIEVIRR